MFDRTQRNDDTTFTTTDYDAQSRTTVWMGGTTADDRVFRAGIAALLQQQNPDGSWGAWRSPREPSSHAVFVPGGNHPSGPAPRPIARRGTRPTAPLGLATLSRGPRLCADTGGGGAVLAGWRAGCDNCALLLPRVRAVTPRRGRCK